MSAREQRLFTFKAYQVIWFVIGLIEALLALRFVLKLVAANPGNAFADFVYRLTDVFLAPFFGLTITPNVGGVVLEFHTVIAMVVYALVGWGLQRLVEVVFYQPVEIPPAQVYVETPPPPAPAVPPHEHITRPEQRHVEPS
jgi:uncharacterized protein YggT (Ycf19 family)